MRIILEGDMMNREFIFVLIAMLLSSLVISAAVSCGDGEEEEEYERWCPCGSKNTLYLHIKDYGDSTGYWADIEMDDSESADTWTDTYTGGDGWSGVAFNIRDDCSSTYERGWNLYFTDDPITGRVHLSFDPIVGGYPKEIRFVFFYYDENDDYQEAGSQKLPYNETDIYLFEFDLDIDVLPKEYHVAVGYLPHYQAGSTEVTHYLNGDSYFVLPLEDDTDLDGEPDFLDTDDDNDGLTDEWEENNDLDPKDPSDADEDTDSDGLNNTQENSYGTDPQDSDSDDDGYTDGEEVAAGSNPLLDSSKPPGEKKSFLEENMMVIAVVVLVIIFLIIILVVGLYVKGKR